MQTNAQAFDEIGMRKARYCRDIDTKQWRDFQDLFADAPDIRFVNVVGDADQTIISVARFVTTTARFLEGSRPIHQIPNAEFERAAEDAVDAIWSMEELLIFPEGDDQRSARMHGYGHYHERWKLEDGQWRIARPELRRTILEITPKEQVQ